MSKLIGVLDYGVAGNLHSIVKAIQAVGGTAVLVQKADDIFKIDKLVIPGVGSFHEAMKMLHSADFIDAINVAVIEKEMPTLGICLGMQLLSKIGFEGGETQGLNFIDAEVRVIKSQGVLPHMGFNQIDIQTESILFEGITKEDDFYFMHSYEVCNYTDITALSSYKNHTFVSSVEKNNVYGVQFHPEKSRESGLKVFSNFVHNT